MIVIVKAKMSNEFDGLIFNELSKWCLGRGVSFNGTITGTRVEITMDGDPMFIQPLIKYLEAYKEFTAYV